MSLPPRQRLVKAQRTVQITAGLHRRENRPGGRYDVRGWGATTLDRASRHRRLIQPFSLWVGKTTTLKDDAGHVAWLNAARKKDWHYWQRYRDFLESQAVMEGRRSGSTDSTD